MPLSGPRPQIVLMNLDQPLTGGSVVSITLTFQRAGQVTLKVPVMPRAQFYTTLRPAPTFDPVRVAHAERHGHPGSSSSPTPSPSSS